MFRVRALPKVLVWKEIAILNSLTDIDMGKCQGCRETHLPQSFFFSFLLFIAGAIIGDRDRKSLDPLAPLIWDNFSIFTTNRAILTSYIRADPRKCRGLSRGCCHVGGSNGESCLSLLWIFHSDGGE